jgi:hypothetical protein
VFRFVSVRTERKKIRFAGHPRPSAPSTALCPLYGPLSRLQGSVSNSSALCLLYGPMFPLWPSVPSTALCQFYGLCPLLMLSMLSMVLYLLNSPPSLLWLSVPSNALCPLQTSLSSIAICLFYPLQPLCPPL